MVSERKIREDHNVSAILLIYSIFSNRNQLSLFSRRACDKVITMTGKKKVGCPCSLVSYSHFSTDRAQYVWVIDQVWGQDGCKFFLCVFVDRDEVEAHKLAKKRTRPISSHLDRRNLVNKGFIIWLLVKFSSLRMRRHIRDLNVESARDLNSIRLPDGQTIKKMTRKWPTTHTCLAFTCFILVFRSGYHMAFVD